MKHYDVITVGAATRDIFLRSDAFTVVNDPNSPSGKEQCLNLGSKIDIEHVVFATGGGATNAAATFANAGMKVAYVGRIGKDEDGDSVLQDLRKHHIDTRFVVRDPKQRTAMSIILSASSLERTVLVHRGASEALQSRDLPLNNAQSHWLYLSSLAGNFTIFNALARVYAKNNGVIAWNPGAQELHKITNLRSALKRISIVILNAEEANELAGTNNLSLQQLAKELRKLTNAIIVLTDGDRGALAMAAQQLFFCEPRKSIRIVERTGAGDAFGSGFVAGLIKSKGNIMSALQYAAANAESVIEEVGAKNGLITKAPSTSLHRVRQSIA